MGREHEALDSVRGEVRKLLGKAQAFEQLSPTERNQLAQNLVKVGSFLADPDWLDDSRPVRAEALAGAGDVAKLRDGLKKQAKGTRANDFEAAAVKQGVEAFGDLVQTVDFPDFVSGLIQGVFQAVVDASIQQMRAYAELLSATAMTVDQFSQAAVGDDEARRQILNRYPHALELKGGDDGSARLKVKEGFAGEIDPAADYGLPPGSIDLDDSDSEQALVGAAKRELGAQKQQMMATMVLLGINRIVVTNGRINAKVVFDVQASDEAKRVAKARSEAESDLRSSMSGSSGFMTSIFGGIRASASARHTTRVASSVDDTSESKANLKAQLTGEVRLNFKSETFPLEKLADSVTIGQLNTNADPNRNAAAAATPAKT